MANATENKDLGFKILNCYKFIEINFYIELIIMPIWHG